MTAFDHTQTRALFATVSDWPRHNVKAPIEQIRPGRTRYVDMCRIPGTNLWFELWRMRKVARLVKRLNMRATIDHEGRMLVLEWGRVGRLRLLGKQPREHSW